MSQCPPRLVPGWPQWLQPSSSAPNGQPPSVTARAFHAQYRLAHQEPLGCHPRVQAGLPALLPQNRYGHSFVLHASAQRCQDSQEHRSSRDTQSPWAIPTDKGVVWGAGTFRTAEKAGGAEAPGSHGPLGSFSTSRGSGVGLCSSHMVRGCGRGRPGLQPPHCPEVGAWLWNEESVGCRKNHTCWRKCGLHLCPHSIPLSPLPG